MRTRNDDAYATAQQVLRSGSGTIECIVWDRVDILFPDLVGGTYLLCNYRYLDGNLNIRQICKL
jgi:hypothetical protein